MELCGGVGVGTYSLHTMLGDSIKTFWKNTVINYEVQIYAMSKDSLESTIIITASGTIY